MSKRGRPPRTAVQRGQLLLQDFTIVAAFESSRKKGEKYDTAIEAARQAVRDDFGIEISKTSAKRGKKRIRNDKSTYGFLLDRRISESEELAEHEQSNRAISFDRPIDSGKPTDTPRKVVCALYGSWGLVPQFRRSNGKKPKL